MISKNNLKGSWVKYLSNEFDKQYMKDINIFLDNEVSSGKIIYPNSNNIFNSLNHTDLENIKVVILGQDPYHGEGQAHGLSFSVQKGVKFPPSLRNIFKELHSDIGTKIPKSGCLYKWASQGVLLLNSILTVEKEKPASHRKIGWETFTDKIISVVNDNTFGTIFILWGNYAKSKKILIYDKKHYIIEGVHPSPLSASRGFFGSKPFSKVNDMLRREGKSEIKW